LPGIFKGVNGAIWIQLQLGIKQLAFAKLSLIIILEALSEYPAA